MLHPNGGSLSSNGEMLSELAATLLAFVEMPSVFPEALSARRATRSGRRGMRSPS
jgi:hypothetical protein